MKELKKGDFTGIYSSIDGKPLYFTGVYSCMEYDGMPCVFLATDLHNNLTFCRWSQQDLNKRGFTIPQRPVEISKTAMQMIQKAGAVIRWTTAEERRQANTDHKRKSPYILTAANGGQWYTTGTCADVREVLKAAADEATTRPQDGHTAPETETAGETTTSSEKAPQEHKTALYKYGMRLRGYSIGAQPAGVISREDDQTGKFYDIIAYNAPLSPEDVKHYSLTPLECPTTAATTPDGETTTEAETAPQEGTQDATERPKRRTAYMVECRSPRGSWKQYSGEKDTREEAEKIKEEAEAQRACTVNGDLILYRIVQLDKGPETASQDAPTARQTAGTNAAEETPTEATKARQEASQDATPATAAGAAESTPGAPQRPEPLQPIHARPEQQKQRHKARNAPPLPEELQPGQRTQTRPATLAKSPQDARKHRKPYQLPPHPTKGRHGAK